MENTSRFLRKLSKHFGEVVEQFQIIFAEIEWKDFEVFWTSE